MSQHTEPQRETEVGQEVEGSGEPWARAFVMGFSGRSGQDRIGKLNKFRIG